MANLSIPRYEVAPLPIVGYAVVLDRQILIDGFPSIVVPASCLSIVDRVSLTPEHGRLYAMPEADAISAVELHRMQVQS